MFITTLRLFFLCWLHDIRSQSLHRRPISYHLTRSIIIDVTSPGVRLVRRLRGAESTLGQFSSIDDPAPLLKTLTASTPAETPITLRIVPDLMIEHILRLPLLSELDLEAVIKIELDRITPFSLDQIYWDWEILRRQTSFTYVKFRLIPKSLVGPVEQCLNKEGYRINFIELSSNNELRMMRIDPPRISRKTVNFSNARATLFGLITGIAVIAGPFVRQWVEGANLDRQLHANPEMIKRVEEAQTALVARSRINRVIAHARDQYGDPLEIVANVTDSLDNDSYLVKLTLSSRLLSLSGLSASAPQLLGVLSRNKLFSNPQFEGPISRSENGHLDSFVINTRVNP